MRTTTLLASLLTLPACEGGPGTPVGVTLGDGQVLIGDVTTQALLLEGAFGQVEIPLDDIGMVLPVEGRTLGDSGGHVTVWLRNGSELRGEWAEPELSMALAVGDAEVPVDVPTETMQALQLQGGEAWPATDLYRVRTTWGDDFLVDPSSTRIVLENDLGEFAPLLSECRSVGPVGASDGAWRIELDTGTVLLGPLKQAEITFALPLGPEVVTVPLDALSLLERGSWGSGGEAGPTVGGVLASTPQSAPASQDDQDLPSRRGLATPPAAVARPALTTSGGWFENARLEDAKR